jgi:hypothetical protein
LDEQAINFENDDGFLKNDGNEQMPFAFADTDENQTESSRQKEKSSAKKEKS